MEMAEWLRSRAAQALLWQRSRPALVRAELAGRPFRLAEPASDSRLRVAAVQRHLHLTASAAQYASEAYTLTAAAVAYGAQLVCFPEHSGTHLLGLLPELALEREDPQLAELFLMASPAAARVFEATWSTLARRFGVTIVAGSIVLADQGGQLYNKVLVYDARGRRLGEQPKLNLFMSERSWMSAGQHLALMRLPTTQLAALPGIDDLYWETARIATARGAELLVAPCAYDGPYLWSGQSRGLWARVQESHAYGIHALLVGEFFGAQFSGRSAIYAPLELTADRSGVLAIADQDSDEAVVVAELDLAALRELRRGALAPRRDLLRRYRERLSTAPSSQSAGLSALSRTGAG